MSFGPWIHSTFETAQIICVVNYFVLNMSIVFNNESFLIQVQIWLNYRLELVFDAFQFELLLFERRIPLEGCLFFIDLRVKWLVFSTVIQQLFRILFIKTEWVALNGIIHRDSCLYFFIAHFTVWFICKILKHSHDHVIFEVTTQHFEEILYAKWFHINYDLISTMENNFTIDVF